MDELSNYELAETDYVSGMKYKDIAEKYGVTINTVKSWKKRYAWARKRVHTKTEKVCTQKQRGAPPAKKAISEDVEQVVTNDKLTDGQRLFCLYYIKYFNATKAYRKAFPEASYHTAAVNGSKLMQMDTIKDAIAQLKQNKFNREMFNEDDLFQMYLDTARADMMDFAEVRGGFVTVRDSEQLDGLLIQELSQGKEGAKIKLLDKAKAMQWLTDHMAMATEKQRAEIDLIKIQTEKLSMEAGAGNEEGVMIVNDVEKEDKDQ